jgi:hypothetical protein
MPSSSFVSRKFGIEVNNNDVDISGCLRNAALAWFNWKLPATGMATIEVGLMGRDMEIYSAPRHRSSPRQPPPERRASLLR